MFKSVLIANRGEIACRIIRTARRLGMRTIAVYSSADARALHVRLADEAHYVGDAPASASYLAIAKILAAAKSARADCIHPGYGFLSENAEFARACAAAGHVFVGPSAAAIESMGLKDRAKALMEKAGVPVVPGYHGERQDPKFLKEKAYEIGYPVLVKAIAGGGGRGMRRVEKHADFDEALVAARREARAAFDDERVLLEKYVNAPRHIEMQVFADNHGHVVHLNERDCTLQRRHQKVIEEAPAPGMSAELRAKMGAAAVAAARAVNYSGAGTVEFIADGAGALRADGFWFMEMNTRLQVEHPVTEMVTGLDLVELQFRVAAGEKLPLSQEKVRLDGHAVEARLYAEDPDRGFLPSTGRLVALEFPAGEGIRVDTGVEAGADITPYYDPMIAKVITHARTREGALERLSDALDRTIVVGPRSNAGFLAQLARAREFREGKFDTGFIARNLAVLTEKRQRDASAVALAAQTFIERERTRIAALAESDADAPPSPWDEMAGFQLGGERITSLPLMADGEPLTAQVHYDARGAMVTVDAMPPARDAKIIEAGDAIYVVRKGRQTRVVRRRTEHSGGVDTGDGQIRAPMHGKILSIFVEKGTQVTRGQRLAIMEAMKMEHTLTAPVDGVVVEVAAAAHMQIAEGALVMRIESE